MNNPDDFLYEYSMIRFVPKIDREEFVNIGLIMMCKRRKWIRSKILINESRIKALFPDVSCEMLSHQVEFFLKDRVPFPDLPVEERYRWLTAMKSAMLQVSPSHPGLLSTNKESGSLSDEAVRLWEEYERINQEKNVIAIMLLEEEFDRLFSQLVEI